MNGRFAKGRSGNPKGRPKAAAEKEASVFDILLDKKLTVTQNGVAREITVEEALHHQTYKEAISGSRMAQRQVLSMIAKREKASTARSGRKFGPNATLRVESVDPENADAALQILGIATRAENMKGPENKPGELSLAPWAVQAALARRRGAGRLGG